MTNEYKKKMYTSLSKYNACPIQLFVIYYLFYFTVLKHKCEFVVQTSGCYFLMKAMLPEGFPSNHCNLTYYSWCLVHVWRLYNVALY